MSFYCMKNNMIMLTSHQINFDIEHYLVLRVSGYLFVLDPIQFPHTTKKKIGKSFHFDNGTIQPLNYISTASQVANANYLSDNRGERNSSPDVKLLSWQS
jgi:hypothetical protein